MRNLIVSLLFSFCAATAWGAKASWITAADDSVNRPNTWIAFQKDVVMKTKPRSLKARIACDSKYWLWVNGNSRYRVRTCRCTPSTAGRLPTSLPGTASSPLSRLALGATVPGAR